MTSMPWGMPDPPDRQHWAASSNARLSVSALPDPPSVAAPPAGGALLMFDDRGIFVRGPHREPGHPTASGTADQASIAHQQTVAPPSAGQADGSAADPEPITLYVHGLAGNSTNFDAVGAVLAGRCRSYAVDLPGFGRSDPPPAEHYSLDDDARIVAEVLRSMSPGRPAHLVGNSLGGMVSILVASRYPELVRTLSLVSPAVPDLRMTSDRGADPRLGLLLAPGTTSLAVRRLGSIDAVSRARGMAALCYGDPSVLTDDDVLAAAVELRWRFPLRWVHTSTIGSVRALMRSYLRVGQRSFRTLAASVSAPTLVVWGTKDRLVDCSLAQPTARSFPDGRLLVLAGCGHVAQMERPDVTARAILALWEDHHAGAASVPQSSVLPDVTPSIA